MTSSVSSRLNAELLDENYAKWQDDPLSVSSDWASFFDGFELGSARAEEFGEEGAEPTANPVGSGDGNFYGKLFRLLYNYRALGHHKATINPLQSEAEEHPSLKLENLGFKEADLDKDASSIMFRDGEKYSLRELIAKLDKTYCGNIGFEYMHIHDPEIRYWMRDKIETANDSYDLTKDEHAKSLKWVLEAELLEEFIGKKFIGEKRFSLEGGEGVMIFLQRLLEECPVAGVDEIEMGMAHRGRLNILAQFVKKKIRTILYEFTPNYTPDLVAGDGDVKYHLGYEKELELEKGKVRVSLAANPSHLEAVNAVVEGKARARQRILGDDGEETNRSRVLPLLLHGDAAFAGQGPVAEVLNLSQLPGYRTGGTIHVIINNQIGFTTMPEDARSSTYSTDVAKMIDAPILHVNGEKPEELVWAALFALEFRQKWGRDIVIDMLCYRRQGHNETDQAAFTQPHIYRAIAGRDPFGKALHKQLVANGTLSADEAQGIYDNIWNELEKGYVEMKEAEEAGERTKFTGSTAVEQSPYSHAPIKTGVDASEIEKVGKVLTEIPSGFKLHPTLAKRFVPRRAEALATGQNFDWAFAESLAWGTLLEEGYPVRLSGQDCRRGTFSHRHAVFYDNLTRERYMPLTNISDSQAKFCVYNSLLSEAAVLGFDYGYSLGCSNMLIMWEAQFGDFANGAQVIIDQFISSAESKWQTPSSLVLLLPHGYEGMGPEHSSARLERFLQLCAEDNMIVGNFTTPAQYFHALRRQKHRDILKPLILMTPKSLLTKPEAVSSLEDFTGDTSFQELLDDNTFSGDKSAVDRLIFCSGKVYYDLLAYRAEQGLDTSAIIRVEQLYPFHAEMAKEIAANYPNASQYVWCQEEPQNMGSWSYINPHLSEAFDARIRYAGRDGASSPAPGSKLQHKKEQKALVEQAFTV